MAVRSMDPKADKVKRLVEHRVELDMWHESDYWIGQVILNYDITNETFETWDGDTDNWRARVPFWMVDCWKALSERERCIVVVMAEAQGKWTEQQRLALEKRASDTWDMEL